MSIFNIDYRSLINNILPVRRRRVIRMAWLNALIAPVIYNYNSFRTNRDKNLYYLTHTSQVCCMEAVLNDMFDPTLKRIYYSDGMVSFTFHAYINIPTVLGLNTDEVTAVINKYRLPGRVAIEIQTF